MIGFGWRGLCLVEYFLWLFTALVLCWVLYSNAFTRIKTDCEECSGHSGPSSDPLSFIDANYRILILKGMYYMLAQKTGSFGLLNLCVFNIV